MEHVIKLLETLVGENELRRKQLDQVTTVLARIEGRIDTLEGTLKVYDARIAGNYNGLAAQYDAMEASLASIERQLGDLRLVAKEVGGDVENLRQSVSDESERVGRRLGSANATIENLVERVDGHETRLTAAEARAKAK